MWGGGNFVTMNKVLPGVYSNISTSGGSSASISDRGLVAIGLPGLTWGPDGTVFKMTASEFYTKGQRIFGVNPMDESMKGVRDFFQYATVGYFYKLGTATKAGNTFADAKYGGTLGNNIQMVVSANADDESKWDVETYVGSKLIDTAVGVSSTDDMVDNDHVIWKDGVAFTVGTVLMSGGADGTADATAYSAFWTAIEPYEELHAIGCLATDESIKNAFVSFIKRLVTEKGYTVQGVVYDMKADNENIVNVKNSVDLVYWASGAVGGCAVNKSMTGKTYNGEFAIPAEYTQSELEQAIKGGEWTLHKVGDDLKVLKDINSLTSFTIDKNESLAYNQVVRATNTFLYAIKQSFQTIDLGNTPNDASGRASVQSRIVENGLRLLDVGAFSEFVDSETIVEAGTDRASIVVTTAFTPATVMEKMYLNMVVN